MEYDDYLKLLLSICSLAIGSLLAAIRSKIPIIKDNKNLHYVFYIFSVLVLLFAAGVMYFFRKQLDELGIILGSTSILASIALIIFTYIFQFGKEIFKSSELDSIVNKFTSDADTNLIKMFGGDLNFIGNTPREMDENSQYNYLKARHFRNLQILCEIPVNNEQKIRYGKILNDFLASDVELKFYDPDDIDLKVRGRIIQIQGRDKLLIYHRLRSKVYKTIQTDTATAEGKLYLNIWNLIWRLAKTPTEAEIQECKTLFAG